MTGQTHTYFRSAQVFISWNNHTNRQHTINLIAHLSAQDAVHHDDDETLEWVKDGKKDLE